MILVGVCTENFERMISLKSEFGILYNTIYCLRKKFKKKLKLYNFMKVIKLLK